MNYSAVTRIRIALQDIREELQSTRERTWFDTQESEVARHVSRIVDVKKRLEDEKAEEIVSEITDEMLHDLVRNPSARKIREDIKDRLLRLCSAIEEAIGTSPAIERFRRERAERIHNEELDAARAEAAAAVAGAAVAGMAALITAAGTFFKQRIDKGREG